MKTKSKISYENEKTICNIEYSGKTFSGIAICHPNDLDMQNRYTGAYIAETRAIITLAKYIKENEIKPAINTIKKLLNSMEQSNKYERNSIERVRKELKSYQKDLISFNKIIKINKQDLYLYIKEKEKLYQKIRKSKNS